MNNLISLKENVLFNHIPSDYLIAFYRLDDFHDYIYILQSQEHYQRVLDLIENRIGIDQLMETFSLEAKSEFQQVISILKKVGVLNATEEEFYSIMNLPSQFKGKFFDFTLTSIAPLELISATTHSEGEACDPVGLTFCETNTGNPFLPREQWECISGMYNNWSAMGVSC